MKGNDNKDVIASNIMWVCLYTINANIETYQMTTGYEIFLLQMDHLFPATYHDKLELVSSMIRLSIWSLSSCSFVSGMLLDSTRGS